MTGEGMSDFKRCKSCGNPVDLDVAKAHDGACPWCLAAFTFSPEPTGIAPPAETSTRFGKYVRTERLGSGGMGEVWKALDTELNRWVALKFLKDEDPSVVARFQREAKTAAALSHSNIAAIYEVGEIEGRHFIAMQHIQGRTMASFPKKDRRLIVRLFRDAARAIDHAHRHGIIHRDLKPENLMVEEREEGWAVVVLDFGLARPIEGGEKLSQSGEVYGTAPFMSPEQARGEHLDERADVYALGATMYDVLTGKPPFEAGNLLEVIRKVGHEEPVRPRKINPRIHRDLETIVMKCLEKDRERRYSNARELAEDLDRFLNSDPIIARPPSTLYRLRMRLGKRKAVAAAIGIALAAVAGFGILWGFHWKPQQDQARLHREGMSIREEMLRLSMAPKVDRERLKRKAAEARALFERANALVETPEAHVMRGRCLQMEGKPAEALAAFERAHALAPDNAESRIDLARALLLDYQERRTPSIVLMSGDKGRQSHKPELKPESAEARKLRERAELLLREKTVEGEKLDLLQGLLAVGRGDYAKASELLGRYNKVDGLDLQALHLEGWSRFLAQDLAGSIEVLSRLANLAPNANDLLWLGTARHQTGDFRGAVAEFTRVLELDPKYEAAYERRAFTRQALGDFKGALADYTKVVELLPGDSSGYAHRAVVRRDLGDLEGAMIDHDKAVELNPRVSASHIDRGGTRHDLGDFEGAIADCDRGLELDANQPAAYSIRGRSRERMGDLRGAIADFTKGLEISPDPADFYGDRGEVRVKLGEIAAAELDFAKAIEIDPKSPQGYAGRARIRYDRGDLQGAAEDLTKIVERNPLDTYALHLRGEVRADQGDLKGAVEDWKKSLETAPPDNQFLRDHLADHLAEAKVYGHRWGDVIKAKKSFDEASSLVARKEYDRAIEVYRPLVESVTKTQYGRLSAYNIACAYALKGEKEAAIDWLEKAFEIGYRDAAHMGRDSDMDSLRGEVRYQKLIERMGAK
jgi:tetratricopeptide (TPR) repeat protein/predicted Ser/Thr protein kinase